MRSLLAEPYSPSWLTRSLRYSTRDSAWIMKGSVDGDCGFGARAVQMCSDANRTMVPSQASLVLDTTRCVSKLLRPFPQVRLLYTPTLRAATGCLSSSGAQVQLQCNHNAVGAVVSDSALVLDLTECTDRIFLRMRNETVRATMTDWCVALFRNSTSPTTDMKNRYAIDCDRLPRDRAIARDRGDICMSGRCCDV